MCFIEDAGLCSPLHVRLKIIFINIPKAVPVILWSLLDEII